MRQHILTAALALALLFTVAGCGSKSGTASHRTEPAGTYAADQDGHVNRSQEGTRDPLTRAGQTARNGAEDVAKGVQDAAKDAKNAVKDAAEDTGEAVKKGAEDVKKAAEDAKNDLTKKDQANTNAGTDNRDQTRLNPTGNTANGGVTPSNNQGNKS